MPSYLLSGNGSAQDELVARGEHDLLFTPGEQGDNLVVLAAPVAFGGAGAPCRMGHGDFSSLLLGSVLRAAEEANGGPGRMCRFATHCLSPAALTRFWNTVLTVVNQLPASAALYFWVHKERGELVSALRNLRAGLIIKIADNKAVIVAGAAGSALTAAQAAVHAAEGHLSSWNVLASDFREVYLPAEPQPGLAAMPGWWQASWSRGALADEDEGTYGAAANAELYSPGRLDHAAGLVAGGGAHTFAKQLVNVTRREALRNGDSNEAYDELPGSVLRHKQVQQLAAAEWPEQLSQWCKTPETKFMDAHALFLFKESIGVLA